MHERSERSYDLIRAGHILRVHWRTVAKWVHAGRLKATGEKIHDRITESDLRAFAAEYDLEWPGEGK